MTEFNTNDEEKRELLRFIETYCAHHSYLGSQFHTIVQILYKEDHLTDKVILSWHDNAKETLKKHES